MLAWITALICEITVFSCPSIINNTGEEVILLISCYFLFLLPFLKIGQSDYHTWYFSLYVLSSWSLPSFTKNVNTWFEKLWEITEKVKTLYTLFLPSWPVCINKWKDVQKVSILKWKNNICSLSIFSLCLQVFSWLLLT